MLKTYLKDLMYTFLTIIIGVLILTVFNYFDILGDKTTNIIKMILVVSTLVFSGFYLSKRSSNRGFLEGIKIGAIISMFLLLVSILGFNKSFEWKNLIYYVILIFSSMTGGIIGKQGHTEEEKN